jgi:hypothetical protein
MAMDRPTREFWPSLMANTGSVVNIIGGFAWTPDPDSMISGTTAVLLGPGYALTNESREQKSL